MSENISFDLFPETSSLYAHRRQYTPKNTENHRGYETNHSLSAAKASHFSPLEMHQIRARLSLSPTYNKIKRETDGLESFQNSSYHSSPRFQERKEDNSLVDGEDYFSTSRLVIHDLRRRLLEAEKEIEVLDSKKEAKKRVSNILSRSQSYNASHSSSYSPSKSYQSPRSPSIKRASYTDYHSPREITPTRPSSIDYHSPRSSSSAKRASHMDYHSPIPMENLSPDRFVATSPTTKQTENELDDLDLEDLKRSVFSIKRQNQKLKAAVTGLLGGQAKTHDSQVAMLESAIIERDKKLSEQEKKIHQVFQLLKESENHQASLASTVEDLKKETEKSEAVLKQRSVQLEKSKDKIRQLRNLAHSPRKDPRSELELSKWKEGYSQLHSTLVQLKQELVNNEKSLKDHVHLRENQLKQKIKETKLEEDRLNTSY